MLTTRQYLKYLQFDNTDYIVYQQIMLSLIIHLLEGVGSRE
jgi:hypothetical protein